MPIAVILIIVGACYGIGALRLRNRSQVKRSAQIWRALALYGGLFVIYVALASPLDEFAEHLLSAHMLQHLLLTLFAAPLLLWARPMRSLIWCLPRFARKTVGLAWNNVRLSRLAHKLLSPAAAWVLFCGVLIFWHVPTIYRWAQDNELRHSFMHLSFLCSGLLFWSIVLEAGRRHLNYAASALFVFSAALVTGLPGALVAFATRPLFSQTIYTPPLSIRMTPLADQQLAGLIMWIPMDLILFSVALALLGASLSRNAQSN